MTVDVIKTKTFILWRSVTDRTNSVITSAVALAWPLLHFNAAASFSFKTARASETFCLSIGAGLTDLKVNYGASFKIELFCSLCNDRISDQRAIDSLVNLIPKWEKTSLYSSSTDNFNEAQVDVSQLLQSDFKRWTVSFNKTKAIRCCKDCLLSKVVKICSQETWWRIAD